MLVGVTCGMASAAVTCPIDVCKTRIVSRDKAQQQAYLAALRAGESIHTNQSTNHTNHINQPY